MNNFQTKEGAYVAIFEHGKAKSGKIVGIVDTKTSKVQFIDGTKKNVENRKLRLVKLREY